jgi:DNA polymerase I-like protein with 3'-5' exonuclease and polymerase domains
MQLGVTYLFDRGIDEATILQEGIEITEPDLALVIQRLGKDIADVSQHAAAIVWFPVYSLAGDCLGWIARPLPTLAPTLKFLTPIGGKAPPYLPLSLCHGKLAPSSPLIVTEGPVKALSCTGAGYPAVGLNGVWCAAETVAGGALILREELRVLAVNGRKVYLAFDADASINPSVRHATIRAAFLFSVEGAEVFQLTSWDMDSGKGIDDLLVNSARNGEGTPAETLAMLMADAVPFFDSIRKNKIDLDAVAAELVGCRMPTLYRSQLCKLLAPKLDVPTEALRALASTEEEKEEQKYGQRFKEEIEPWAEPVDGHDLAEQLCTVFKRYLVLDDGAIRTLVLWVFGSYLANCFQKFPILRVLSPVKRCGKSTLLDCLELLVCKPLVTASISAPSLYRLIEKFHPTMLMDEADSFAKDDEDIRNICNGGYEKGRPAIRVNKETMEPEIFDTFGPKVLASIGELHPTIEDRSLFVRMERKPRGKDVEMLCDDPKLPFLELRRKLVRWANDHAVRIESTRVSRPLHLDSRAWDKWRPMYAIVSYFKDGSKWSYYAGNISGKMTREYDEEDSVGAEILLRLRGMFRRRLRQLEAEYKRTGMDWEKRGAEDDKWSRFLPTTDILAEFNADEEAPWADWKKGDKEGLTAEKLSKQLKLFKIKSVQLQYNEKRHRGYLLDAALEKVFAAYLPPELPPSSDDDPDDNGPDNNGPDNNGPEAPVDTTLPLCTPENGLQPVHQAVDPALVGLRSAQVENSTRAPSPSAQVENTNPCTINPSGQMTFDLVHGLSPVLEGTESESEVEPCTQYDFLETDHFIYCALHDKAVELFRELQANPSPLIALDLETFGPGEKGGLYPDLGHIRLLSVCVPCSKPVLFDVGCMGYASLPWSELFAGRETVAHNACFEIKWILDKFGFRIPKVFDTMLAARHLQNGIDGERQHVGLATVMQRYLGRTLSKEQQRSDFGREFLTLSQLEYAAGDVEHLNLLRQELRFRLNGADGGSLLPVFELDMEHLLVIATREWRGLRFDRAKAQSLLSAAQETLLRTQAELAQLFGADVLLSSPSQVLKAFARLGLSLGDTGDDSLNQVDHPAAKLLQEHRRAEAAIKEVVRILEYVHPNGRIYPDIDPMGTETGRLLTTKPTINNLSTETGIRSCIFPENDGDVVVKCDFSREEPRIAADVFNVKALLDDFHSGRDMYRGFAAAIFGIDPEKVTPEQVITGKPNFLGRTYGEGPETLQKEAAAAGHDLFDDLAQQICDAFDRTYPEIHEAWNQAKRDAGHGRITYGKSRYGRRRLLLPYRDQPTKGFTDRILNPALEEFFGSIKEATKARKLAAKTEPPEGKSESARIKNAARRIQIEAARLKWAEWETHHLPIHSAGIAKAWAKYEKRRVNWDAQQLEINFKIQGGASDVIRKAEILVDERLPEDSSILLSNHDEICVSCPKAKAAAIQKLVQEAMHDAFSFFYPNVPIASDPEIHDTWT